MKKIFLATSGLIAAGLVATTSAQAADPIKLGLSGFVEEWVGFASNDDPNANTDYGSFDVKADSEIHFVGETKLDNGLSVGVHMELEANKSGSGNIDDSYMTIGSDTFGTLMMGEADPAAGAMHVAAPEVGIGNQDGDYSNWIARPTNVTDQADTLAKPGDIGNGNGVYYYSPSFQGLSLGLSYQPNTDTDSEQGPVNKNTERSLTSASLGYSRDFDGGSVAASLGYSSMNNGAATESEARDWSAGLSVTYGAFTVGGSYSKHEDKEGTTATTSSDGHSFDLGAAYETGPYGVSINWFHSKAEGVIATADDDKVDSIMLSGSYNMGPGIDLKGTLLHVDYDDETTAQANNNDGWAAVVGVAVSF
ncbi:MAG: porin [Rhodospirillales bacterium]|nr:porin [Rhodospirillales bacterium]